MRSISLLAQLFVGKTEKRSYAVRLVVQRYAAVVGSADTRAEVFKHLPPWAARLVLCRIIDKGYAYYYRVLVW